MHEAHDREISNGFIVGSLNDNGLSSKPYPVNLGSRGDLVLAYLTIAFHFTVKSESDCSLDLHCNSHDSLIVL
jgi:hypothetical protein